MSRDKKSKKKPLDDREEDLKALVRQTLDDDVEEGRLTELTAEEAIAFASAEGAGACAYLDATTEDYSHRAILVVILNARRRFNKALSLLARAEFTLDNEDKEPSK